MKNVQIKLDNMGNAHVTADKHEMLVMVNWEWNSYNNSHYARFAVKSSLGYSGISVDEWDVDRATKDLPEASTLRAMFILAKTVLELHEPPARSAEVSEEEVATE